MFKSEKRCASEKIERISNQEFRLSNNIRCKTRQNVESQSVSRNRENN